MQCKASERTSACALVQIWCKVLACGLATFGATADEQLGALLYLETSQAGEPADDFVVRIAPKMYATSRALRVEVCGTLESTNGVLVLAIHKGERHRCFVERDGLPYVHTHPPYGRESWQFSDSDYSRPGYLISEIAISYQEGGRPRRLARLPRSH